MIPAASIKNFDTLCRASHNRDLCIVASRLAATREPVALLTARVRHGAETVAVPLGLMREPGLLDDQGNLAPAAKKKFDRLQKNLRSEDDQPWFFAGDDGKVTVAFAKIGETPPQSAAVLTLPWDNPYELFEDPTAAAAPPVM